MPAPVAEGVPSDPAQGVTPLLLLLLMLSFHFLTLIPGGAGLFPGGRDQEALPNSQQPIQALSGAADENPQCLPAVLCPLHQAQRVQEAHGKPNLLLFYSGMDVSVEAASLWASWRCLETGP